MHSCHPYVTFSYFQVESQKIEKAWLRENQVIVAVCGAILHEFITWQSHGFNYFWPSNILNWGFPCFWKIIPHLSMARKAYHISENHNMWSFGIPLHPTWNIPNAIYHVVCQQPWHNTTYLFIVLIYYVEYPANLGWILLIYCVNIAIKDSNWKTVAFQRLLSNSKYFTNMMEFFIIIILHKIIMFVSWR